MRRDSFKNVRFGGAGSRASSKSSSPKTVIHSSPPINPYKDIQRSFPSVSLYLYHDFILLWIFLIIVGYMLGQLYLSYGQSVWTWDGLGAITIFCCVVNEIATILSTKNVTVRIRSKRSWKQAFLRFKWPISLNILLAFISCTWIILDANRTNCLRGLMSVAVFNGSVFVSWISSFIQSKPIKLVANVKRGKEFLVQNSTESTFITSITSIILLASWQSMKLCIYCTISSVVFVLLDEYHVSYSISSLFLHGIMGTFSIFPFLLLYYLELNRTSLILQIKSITHYLEQRPATSNWMMKLMRFFVDQELKSLQYYPGKHSFTSIICSSLFCCWIFLEVLCLLFSSHRRLNRILIFEILLDLVVLYGFLHTYSRVPSFIRSASDGFGSTTGSSLSTAHQHLMVGEHDKNFKVIVSQQLTELEVQIRYEDYQHRIEELENSIAVEINQQRLQHQSSLSNINTSKSNPEIGNVNNRQRTIQRHQQHSMTQLNTEINGSKLESNR